MWGEKARVGRPPWPVAQRPAPSRQTFLHGIRQAHLSSRNDHNLHAVYKVHGCADAVMAFSFATHPYHVACSDSPTGAWVAVAFSLLLRVLAQRATH